MSSRSWSADALVLSLSTFGENHLNAQLLIPHGEQCVLVPAAIFGGSRSKLRGLVTPYQSGTVWIYTNPVKNAHKITDFSISSYRLELRESIVRTWAAALCSELVLKMNGITDWRLINAFLDGLCVSDDEGCKKGLLRFLWRILTYAGVAPDPSCCGRCGIPFSADRAEAAALYHPIEEVFFCKACADYTAESLFLNTEALTYLNAVNNRAAGYSRHLPLSPAGYGELKRLLFLLIEKLIGCRLKTIETGMGIF